MTGSKQISAEIILNFRQRWPLSYGNH